MYAKVFERTRRERFDKFIHPCVLGSEYGIGASSTVFLFYFSLYFISFRPNFHRKSASFTINLRYMYIQTFVSITFAPLKSVCVLRRVALFARFSQYRDRSSPGPYDESENCQPGRIHVYLHLYLSGGNDGILQAYPHISLSP